MECNTIKKKKKRVLFQLVELRVNLDEPTCIQVTEKLKTFGVLYNKDQGTGVLSVFRTFLQTLGLRPRPHPQDGLCKGLVY